MFGWEIEQVIKQIPIVNAHFDGTFMIDELSDLLDKIKVHGFIIVNTEPSYKVGSHWFTIFKIAQSQIEIFDPLGFPSWKSQHILTRHFRGHFVYNRHPVQETTSSTCGKFCVTFAVHRVWNIGYPFQAIVQDIFSANLHKNEFFVNNFYNWLQ